MNIGLMLRENRVYSDVIKLSFFKFSDGFCHNFYSMCKIEAQEGSASFVSIPNAFRE